MLQSVCDFVLTLCLIHNDCKEGNQLSAFPPPPRFGGQAAYSCQLSQIKGKRQTEETVGRDLRLGRRPVSRLSHVAAPRRSGICLLPSAFCRDSESP